jgi:asparagine synthase (glutamine-hydrolysing)
MCGIAGLYNFDRSNPVDRQTIEEMTSRLAHRGPNGHGVFVEGNIGLGHRRLSVIDIATGAQPMTDAGTGCTIVYNGEFFNFMEIRSQLQATGHTFRTKSDTEVLLKMARGDCRDWIAPLNGMFAFAIWDPTSRSLTLVRDRFGVKPLYYVETGAGVAFASEIKALVGISCGVPPELDTARLAEYLAFRHVLEPNTLFKGVRQVPSGHFMRLSDASRRPEIVRYWTEGDALRESGRRRSEPEEFGAVFARAVRQRLVSDVPLGSFNSGGVDSSLVTREVRRQRSGELHTFSIGFPDERFDESRFALEVAGQLGTRHHAESLTPASFAALLPTAIWHHDEPLCHPHSVQLMHLSAIARRHVTVVLTGEGADEVFCGYPRLHIPRLARMLGPAGRLVAAALGSVSNGGRFRRLGKLAESIGRPLAAEIDSHRFLPMQVLQRLCGTTDYLGARPDTLGDVVGGQSALEGLLEYERRSYLKSLVIRLDKMTMAHGLEARTPFLDFQLVLWSKGLPSSAKVGLGLQNKRLLKAEAARHFTRGLVYRRKMGFDVPLGEWFRTEPGLRDMLAQVVSANSFVGSALPIDAIRDLVTDHCEREIDQSEALWSLLNLECWASSMLRQPGSRP